MDHNNSRAVDNRSVPISLLLHADVVNTQT